MEKKDREKKEEELAVFELACQDVPWLSNLKLVRHDDRPDFVLANAEGDIVGLEHFRADTYRTIDPIQPTHVVGGHTVLKDKADVLMAEYQLLALSNNWTAEINLAAEHGLMDLVKTNIELQAAYTYEEFLDNLHVTIHGRIPKPKGHVQKSQAYPDRGKYAAMGFLIGVPVPSFDYHFESSKSQALSQAKNVLQSSPFQCGDLSKIERRYNDCSSQRINGLPITKEIWAELNVFDVIDFVIIETYCSRVPYQHYAQYFDKDTQISTLYPAFSFGMTDVKQVEIEQQNVQGKRGYVWKLGTNRGKYDVVFTKTQRKKERRKYTRGSRKHFDTAIDKCPYFH